jgi:hypothetical protein
MPAFASRLARHRAWVLAAAVLLGIVAGGGLRPAPAVIPEALGAPIEIRIAQKAADPKAADETEADEPAEKPKGGDGKTERKKGASVGVTIDTLKIDISFIADLETDPGDAAITEAIIGLARGLGLKVVAEGVGTREQLEFLDARGCHCFQGFWVSKPLPPLKFVEFLRKRAGAL